MATDTFTPAEPLPGQHSGDTMTITTAAPNTTERDVGSGGDASTWTRIAGICGIVAAVLWFGMGAAIASDAPALGDSADEIRTWMQDNQSAVAIFTCGMALAVTLLLVYGAGLRRRLAPVDRSGFLSDVFYAALVANVAAGLVGLSFWATLSHDAVVGLSDDIILTLSTLDTIFFFAILPWTFAAMLVSASIVIVQSRIMPAWLGGLGLVCGVANAIATFWLPSGDADSFLAVGPGFLGFLGTLLWFAITGGYLARGERA